MRARATPWPFNYGGTMNNQNLNFWDALNLLNIYSVYLALENLYENRAQTEQNDVNAANDRQAQFLLEELGKKFDEQNEILRRILEHMSTE